MSKMVSMEQIKKSEDGQSLSLGGRVFYAGEMNAVELLTPEGWLEVLLELDEKLGWIATTEAHSESKGFYVATLDVNPVGMIARLPR